MSEAVFSITASIEPQLDERELQRQAQAMAGQLNDLLSKNIKKVGISGDTNSFNDFKNQVQEASKFTGIFEKVVGGVKNTVTKVAKGSREEFLKFTDAIDLTNRGIVGFGGTVSEIIEKTAGFKAALDNIQTSGSVFQDLQGGFQATAATVRSGVSSLDQFAAAGDHLSQIFLPMTRISAASQLQLEGLTQTLESLGNKFSNFGKKVAVGADGSRASLGRMDAGFNNLVRSAEALGRGLQEGSEAQRIYFGTIDQAVNKGGVDDVIKGMILEKKHAQELTGPLGFLYQAFGKVDKATRDSAKTLEKGINKDLFKYDPGELSKWALFTTRISLFGDSVKAAGRTFNSFRSGLANLIPGENIGTRLSRMFVTAGTDGQTFFTALKNKFDLFRSQGQASNFAIRNAFRDTFNASNFGVGLAKAKSLFADLKVEAVHTGKDIEGALIRASRAFKASDFGKEMMAAIQTVRGGFNLMGEGVKEVGAVLGDMGKTGLSKLGDAFNASKFRATSIDVLKETGTGLATLGSSAVHTGTEMGHALGSAFDTARIGVRLYADAIGDKLSKAFTATRGIGSQLTSELGTRFSTLRILLNPIGEDITNLGKAFGRLFNVASDVGRSLKPVGTAYTDKFASGLSSAQVRLKSFADTALTIGKAIGLPVVAPFINAFSMIKGAVDKALTAFNASRFSAPFLAGVDKIKTGFKTVVTGVQDMGSAIGKLLPQGFTKAQESLTDFLKNVSGSKIATALSPVTSAISSSVSNLVKTGNIFKPKAVKSSNVAGAEKVLTEEAKSSEIKAVESATPISVKAPLIITATSVKINDIGSQEIKKAVVVKAPLSIQATSVTTPNIQQGMQAAKAYSDTFSQQLAANEPIQKSLNEVKLSAAPLTGKMADFGNGLASPFLSGFEKRANMGLPGLGMQAGNSLAGGMRTALDSDLPGIAANMMSGFGIDKVSSEGKKIGKAASNGITSELDKIGSAEEDATKSVSEGFGKLGKGIISALNPFKTFSTIVKTGLETLTSVAKVAGFALAGLAATTIFAGVEFNNLQASIYGALPALVGSRQLSDQLITSINNLSGAATHMGAFMQTTKILASVGVEAGKIAPLLDGIQKAVAATGGSDQNINQLGDAFARMKSQGTLSMAGIKVFSDSGINALGMLGDALGKTTGQIRIMINQGIIPANEAIDILSKGMVTKFTGAADAVSKTLPGALGALHARLDELGGSLVSVFVSPTGGGALIDFINHLSTSVEYLTKNILPLLQPLMQSIGNVMSEVGTKIEAFVTALHPDAVGKMAKSLSGLGPALAIVAGFVPELLGFIPVIGPIIASLGGAHTALLLFGATIPEVRSALGGLGSSIMSTLGNILPKISDAFGHLTKAIGPIFAQVVRALGPIFSATGAAIGELLTQLGPIFDAFGRLFNALAPVVDIIKNFLIGQLQIVQGIFSLLGPIIAIIVNKIADLVEAIKPFLEKLDAIMQHQNDLKSIQQGFDDIKGAICGAYNAGAQFLGIVGDIAKKINEGSGGLIGKGLKIAGGVVKEGAKLAVGGLVGDLPNIGPKNAIQKESDAFKQASEDVRKGAKDSAAAITDNYNKASKAVEVANNNLQDASDLMKKMIQSVGSLVDPVLDAGKAAKEAHIAETEASLKASQSAEDYTRLQREQIKVIALTITPVNELAAANRDLRAVQTSLVDLGYEQVDINRDLVNLMGQQSTDKRASLDRDQERAKIALNKARQDEIDLTKQMSILQAPAENLAGLSIDQIHRRLATMKEVLKTQQMTLPLTKQQIADQKESAHLDVADAAQGITDAARAKTQFELDTTKSIRTDQERLLAIQDEKAAKQVEEQTQLTSISFLMQGQTTMEQALFDNGRKLLAAKNDTVTTQRQLTAAIVASKIADETVVLQSAAMRDDTTTMRDAQQKIWGYKHEGLSFDSQTETSLTNQYNTLVKQQGVMKDMNDSAVAAAKALATAQSVVNLGTDLGAFSGIINNVSAEGGNIKPADAAKLAKIPDELTTLFSDINQGGVFKNAVGATVTLSDAQLKSLVQQLLTTPGNDLRLILQSLLKTAGPGGTVVSIPGFAAGFAPSIGGMNDGKGLVRMFEFGKEAVLPLTRKLDMFKVVNNPSVLPKILEALPTWSMPTHNLSEGNRAVEGLNALNKVTGSSIAQSSIDRKKEQREFASNVGSAVKSAVKDALSESGGSIGSNVAIDVHPSSNNEVVIAREVKRQLEMALK